MLLCLRHIESDVVLFLDEPLLPGLQSLLAVGEFVFFDFGCASKLCLTTSQLGFAVLEVLLSCVKVMLAFIETFLAGFEQVPTFLELLLQGS